LKNGVVGDIHISNDRDYRKKLNPIKVLLAYFPTLASWRLGALAVNPHLTRFSRGIRVLAGIKRKTHGGF
jgi:hypothetical protein